MAAVVDDVPTDDVDAKAGARCDRRSPLCLIPEQRPVRDLEEFEEPGRLASGAPHGRVRPASARSDAVAALGLFQRQGGSPIAEIELVDLTAPVRRLLPKYFG